MSYMNHEEEFREGDGMGGGERRTCGGEYDMK